MFAIELGWDYQTFERQPHYLIEAIARLWKKRAEAQKRARKS
jgi:hypothetical protein